MQRRDRAVIAGAALLLGAGVAAAAPAAAGEWSGSYIGGDAGAAFGGTHNSTVVACETGGLLCAPDVQEDNGAWVSQVGTGSGKAAAFTGGIFAGHNWQGGNFVYGLEGDFGAMPLSVTVGGSASTLNEGLHNGDTPSVFTMTTTVSTDWLASARVRAGVLVRPDLLLYGTAGLSATSLSVANSYSDNFNDSDRVTGAVESSRATALRAGLIIGVGAEWAASAHWKVRAEYLHTEFGSLSTTGLVDLPPEVYNVNPITSTANLRADLVRVGVSYGF